MVLLLSIENFAAVVSDNDGSAFITKAEFDSLKNSFQSQIDQYNTSLDSKIDGAIASYLAGIKVAKKDNLTSLIETLSNEKKTFRFANWNNYNSGNVVAGDAGIQVVRLRGYWTDTSQSTDYRYTYYCRILLNGGTSYSKKNNYSSQPTYGWWTPISYNREGGYYYVPEDYQYREIMHYSATNGLYASQVLSSAPEWEDGYSENLDVVFNPTNTNSDPVVKSYKFALKNEAVEYLSSLTSTLTLGTTNTNYCGNLRTQCLNQISSNSYWFLDYDNQGTYTNTKKFQMDVNVYRLNAIVYRRDSSLNQTQYKSAGQNEFASTISTNSTKKISISLDNIVNQTLSNLTGEVVYLYGGLPMCHLPGKQGKLSFEIELTKPAIICLKYGQFANEVVTESYTDCDKNYGVLTAGTHKLEFDMNDEKWNKKDGLLWLKLNRTVTADSVIRVNVTNIVFESE